MADSNEVTAHSAGDGEDDAGCWVNLHANLTDDDQVVAHSIRNAEDDASCWVHLHAN